MLHTLILCMSLALQGANASKTAAPAAKPAAPIATAPAGVSGPSVDVPAELARLTGPGTVAVLFVPNVAQLQSALERLTDAGGSMGSGLPNAASLRQLLKQGVRTELDVPLDQPALWWVDMRQPEGDEPPMGFDNLVMHQAFRIPGATAATEKARADAAKADPKQRPTMPVRARDRRGAVSVLPGDLVVLSSDGEPTAAAVDGATPSALLDRMPRGQVSGRVDLGRVMTENADQLRMLGSFASMALNRGAQPGDEASEQERREAEMRQALGVGIGRQVNGLIDALVQLKRASFALDLQGDELQVWADWSRELAFPAGLDEAAVRPLAERLPAGLAAYVGASGSALDATFGERFTIDDVLATLGDTPEQKQAWETGTQRMRAAIAQIERGAVAGVSMREDEPVLVAAFRVKDVAAFRGALTEGAAQMSKSGLAEVKVTGAGDRMEWVAVPSAQRLRDLAAMTGTSGEALETMLKQADRAWRISMQFRGTEVLAVQSRGDATIDLATLGSKDVADLRGQLGRGAWGTMDWFAVTDVRGLIVRTMIEVPRGAGVDKAEAAEFNKQIEMMRKGRPMLLRASQGVQGGTARLSITANLADLKALLADFEALGKLAGPKAGGDADDDDDDDDHGKGAKQRRGGDDDDDGT